MNFTKGLMLVCVLLMSMTAYSMPQYVDNVGYFLFKFNLDEDNLKLDLDSSPYGISVSEKGNVNNLVFAMNSALFEDSPSYKLVGLEVKSSNGVSKVTSGLIDPKTKTGNFGIHNMDVGGNGVLNNGVFFITIRDYKLQAHILKYEDFKSGFYTDSNAAIKLRDGSYPDGTPQYFNYKIITAVQSSPIILSGNVNPNNKSSTNRETRSGIGFSQDGKTVIFISTKAKYSFSELAELFYNNGASDAIYLDGCTNSSLYVDKQRNLKITTGSSMVACINDVPYTRKVAGTWVVTKK